MTTEQYQKLYPDLLAKGGLLNVVRELLASNPAIAINGWGANYAHIQCGERSAQIFIGSEERRFDFDLWQNSKGLANGEHVDIEQVVQVIKEWVAGSKTVEDMEQLFGFVRIKTNDTRSQVKPGAYVKDGDKLRKI